MTGIRKVAIATLLAGAAVLTSGACGPQDAGGDGSEVTVDTPLVGGVSRTGKYEISWEPAGGALPFNELFSILVDVREGGEPITGAIVSATCDMPAHGHGMKVEPTFEELGVGRYRLDGMLLHMKGEWELGISVVVDSLAETADFPLRLE